MINEAFDCGYYRRIDTLEMLNDHFELTISSYGSFYQSIRPLKHYYDEIFINQIFVFLANVVRCVLLPLNEGDNSEEIPVKCRRLTDLCLFYNFSFHPISTISFALGSNDSVTDRINVDSSYEGSLSFSSAEDSSSDIANPSILHLLYLKKTPTYLRKTLKQGEPAAPSQLRCNRASILEFLVDLIKHIISSGRRPEAHLNSQVNTNLFQSNISSMRLPSRSLISIS